MKPLHGVYRFFLLRAEQPGCDCRSPPSLRNLYTFQRTPYDIFIPRGVALRHRFSIYASIFAIQFMDTTDMQAIAMVWLYLLLSYLLIFGCIQLGSLPRKEKNREGKS